MPSHESVILIVDDSSLARNILESLLSNEGYRLVFAENGAGAIRTALEEYPDLILLDVTMPDMDGFEVCRKIRSDHFLAEVPIIMATALDDSASQIEGLKAGADDFILKPYNSGELRTRVRTITRLNRYRRIKSSETNYRNLFENMMVGFAYCRMLFDDNCNPADFIYLDVNRAFGELTGLEDVIDKKVSEVIPGLRASNPELLETYGRVSLTGIPEKFDTFIEPLKMWFSASAYSSERGYFIAVFDNITERKKTEDALRLMAQAFEHSGEAIVITGPDNTILTTNKSFTRMTGYSQEEALGQNPSILQSGKETKEFYASMWASILNNNYWQGEIWDKRKNGSFYPKYLTISGVRNDQGIITNFIGNFTDITEQKNAAEKIEHLAHYDPLTNLPNRFSLMERFSQALQQAKRSSSRLGILFIDLDRFKDINDTLGHHVGDLLLSHVALRLTNAVRGADIVARLGGDEFVVVLPQIQTGVDAAHLALKIQQALSHSYQLVNHSLNITSSIGISIFPDDGETIDDLMKHADLAMYYAKSIGRNNYQFFKPEMNSSVHERLLLENDLRTAIIREDFFLHYQPQIEVTTGRMVGVEALVRWQHPERGLVLPDMFIPIAEETGLILQIGDLVLKAACRQLTDWKSEGLTPVRMAVNLSARQFKQENLTRLVADIITETGVDPHLLELEITESAAMDDPEAAIIHLRRFRKMGVELAIDDFGTGYSSLSYLRLFPVNRLKIDRSFVQNLATNADDGAIAAAIITLAHTLGKEVIAEGVENEAQLNYLKDHRCDIVQGNFFSLPLPADKITELLRSGFKKKE
ncbi:MAG: EAL domain-containing protein [Desulfuromonadales bacterium]|nr:EAL domain-containing protein [Desulfuromonadales bacterium]